QKINSEAGPDNTELQPVQELLNYKDKFLDLDIEFTEAKEINLVSVILEAENENEAMQK
ncbi:4436_t:CDS:2, partial [Cetraspora pellucida]